jgi:hypothetical protein
MKKFLTKVLPWLIGVGLLINLWRKFPPEQFKEAFQHAGWTLFPLIFLALLWLPTDVFALSRFLRKGSFTPRLGMIEWGAEGLSTMIPVGGLGGEPFRYLHLKRYSDEPVKVLVGYRTFHAWTGLFATVIGTTLCWVTGQPGKNWPWLTGVGAAVFVAGCVALWFVRKKYWAQISVSRLLQAFVAKTFSRLFQVLEVAMILLALGADLTLGQVLVVHTYLLVAASIFVFIPGGYGVQENALVAGTEMAGLGTELGFQLGLLRRFRQIGWSSVGLLIALSLEGSRKKHNPQPDDADAPDGKTADQEPKPEN